MGYYKFNKPDDAKKNPHYFLSEETLVPWTNASDTQRLNMFSNHFNQASHLVKPEIPRVLTGFENQVGEYSIAYKKADEDFRLVRRIYKNQYNYVEIIQYVASGVYDAIFYHTAKRITEDYGYKVNDCIESKNEGDIVKKGDFVYKSDNYDDDGNFMYGLNLRAVYLPWNLLN